MKKILMAIVAVASCMTASAQFWVAGSLGFESESRYEVDDKQTTWSISPSIGYALDDALEVGLGLSLSGDKYFSGNKNSAFSIAPFARYTFLTDGNFSMYLQGNIGLNTNNYKTTYYDAIQDKDVTTETKSTSWGISVCPGVKYILTDQFAVVASLGGLYFNHNKKPNNAGSSKNDINLNLSTRLNFGLVYSF